MDKYIMAQENGRSITGEDKIFGINKKAKEMIQKVGKQNVANATVGSLLDEEGNLVVLTSVIQILKELAPVDYAEYAPITGVPSFIEAAMKAVFMDFTPSCHIEAVATPGGTGAIHNAIQNYTKRGDTILTTDWYWSPYKTITEELERTIDTFPIFDEVNNFNHKAFEKKFNEIMSKQDRLVLILNTPSHNPTGYSITLEDWDKIIETIKKVAIDDTKKIALLVDVAYIDFAGDAKEYRAFLPKLEGLPENILPLIAFSMSKSYTLYGMRGGALICMSPNKAITDEFKIVNSFSCRGTWSNGNRSAMTALSHIYEDKSLLEKVRNEREAALAMLKQRGKVFMDEAKKVGLDTCPYDSGFFIIINCQNPDAVSQDLFNEGIFTVPFNGRGLRISIASISKAWCSVLPEKIIAAIKKVNG